MPRNTRPGSKVIDTSGRLCFMRFEGFIHAAVNSFHATTGIPRDELEGAAREIYARALNSYRLEKGRPFGCLLSTMLRFELINFCQQYGKQFNRSIPGTSERAFVNVDWAAAESGDDESGANMAYIAREDSGYSGVEFRELIDSLSPEARRLVKDLMDSEQLPVRRSCSDDVARFAAKYLGWTLREAKSAAREIHKALFMEYAS